MQIQKFVLGGFETNSYVLTSSDQSQSCLIIDTGLSNVELIEYLKISNLTPEAVILTHGHADHIAGVIELRQDFPDIKVVIHAGDADMLTNPRQNLSMLAGANISTEPADVIIEDEGNISFAGIELKVLHTPGHSQGGISLYNADDNVAFVGDTLFDGSVGRTDFPGGSAKQLISSIKEKLLTLPEETKCCPGHGPDTTVLREKKTNPFLR